MNLSSDPLGCPSARMPQGNRGYMKQQNIYFEKEYKENPPIVYCLETAHVEIIFVPTRIVQLTLFSKKETGDFYDYLY